MRICLESNSIAIFCEKFRDPAINLRASNPEGQTYSSERDLLVSNQVQGQQLGLVTMNPFNQTQTAGLDQYSDGAAAAEVNSSFGYDGTSLATQLLLRPLCVFITAALASAYNASLPQDCSLLPLAAPQLCVSTDVDKY